MSSGGIGLGDDGSRASSPPLPAAEVERRCGGAVADPMRHFAGLPTDNAHRSALARAANLISRGLVSFPDFTLSENDIFGVKGQSVSGSRD